MAGRLDFVLQHGLCLLGSCPVFKPSSLAPSPCLSNSFPPKASQSQFLFLHQGSLLINGPFLFPFHTVSARNIPPVTCTAILM